MARCPEPKADATFQALMDVYSRREIAAAAQVSPRAVAALVASGAASTLDGEFFDEPEAIRLVRLLRSEPPASARRPDPSPPDSRLAPDALGAVRRGSAPRALALAASGTLHTAALTLLAIVSSLGLVDGSAARESTPTAAPSVHLVFVASPGPGGGGGGGGLRQAAIPPPASLEGRARQTSPVPLRRPPSRPAPARLEMPLRRSAPLDGGPLPPLVAPVVSAASQALDRTGVLSDTSAATDSRGPGVGAGVGTGAGMGLGEGQGPGLGPGWGGGYGGGPYRPGSGVEPPHLLREVKPRYDEAARRAGIEGEVVLEVVVRADGTVGDLRVLQGLGGGLDARAAEAVRQWRFAPGLRQGTPVDVIVEVSVEFRLR